MKYDIDQKLFTKVKGAWSLIGQYYKGKYKDMLLIGVMTLDGPGESYLTKYILINYDGSETLKIGDENNLKMFLLNNSEGFMEIKREKIYLPSYC